MKQEIGRSGGSWGHECVSAFAPGLLFSLLISAALAALACRDAPRAAPAARPAVGWRAVGSWSGSGNKQTESFRSESGALRIRWTTTRRGDQAGGGFRLTAHSAISGRLLEQVVDQHGAGQGTGYVNQDPHVFYLMVESDRLDWTFAVDEGIPVAIR